MDMMLKFSKLTILCVSELFKGSSLVWNRIFY